MFEAFGFLTKATIIYGSDVLSKGRYEVCYDKALKIRRKAVEALGELFAKFDALLMPAYSKADFETYDMITELTQLKLMNNFYLPVYLRKFTVKAYNNQQIQYTNEEAEQILGSNLEYFMKKLEEKGLQIFENDVKIEQDGERMIAKGTLTLNESITSFKEGSQVNLQNKNIDELDLLYNILNNLKECNIDNFSPSKCEETIATRMGRFYKTIRKFGDENVKLNASNDWTCTWIDLPLEDSETGEKYYYYVLETMTEKSEEDAQSNEITDGVIESHKYSAFYEITDQTASNTEFQISNNRKSITVQKQWLDEEDVDVSNVIDITSIELEVLKKVETKPETLKIHALGDSITDGSLCGGGISYANTKSDWSTGTEVKTCLLADTLTDMYGFTNVSVCEEGTNADQTNPDL